MKEFRAYHPIVNFTYFLLVIGLSVFLMHPVSLAITLFSALMYIWALNGRRKVFFTALLIIPTMLILAVVNPMFNHAGITVITYLPSGNPLTAESVFYGIAAAVMFAALICHFNCYNQIITSDKFIYLFGKIIPVMSLVISMTLRFVPEFISRLKEITRVQKSLGRDVSSGNLIKRLRCGIKILSILVTWSLESAVETADSMKSRGYGLRGRTAYTIFHFDKRDMWAMLWMCITASIVFFGLFSKIIHYSYFPVFIIEKISLASLGIHISYLLLCITPVIIEIREEYRWKAIKSKI